MTRLVRLLPSFEVSLSSITEDQTDATGVRVGANLAVTYASTKPPMKVGS